MSVLYSVARGWVIRGWVGGGIGTELWSMGPCCAQGMVDVKEPAFSKRALSNRVCVGVYQNQFHAVCWCVKPLPCMCWCVWNHLNIMFGVWNHVWGVHVGVWNHLCGVWVLVCETTYAEQDVFPCYVQLLPYLLIQSTHTHTHTHTQSLFWFHI